MSKPTHVELDLRYLAARGLWMSMGYVHEEWDAEDFARDVMQAFMGGVDPGAGESVFPGWPCRITTSTSSERW